MNLQESKSESHSSVTAPGGGGGGGGGAMRIIAPYPSPRREAMYAPIASDAVAAGLGALST